jgi:hypothetical protein
MIRIVIWTNLNAQSVCTYQIWVFLILRCSTRSEDSIDYEFIIFGWTEQKIWIYQANKRFDSNLKIVSNWTHKIWIIIVLLDYTFPKDFNGISFAIFGCRDQKIWILQDWVEIWFEILNRIYVSTEVCHVLCSDWKVPLRPDRLCEPQDQKKI